MDNDAVSLIKGMILAGVVIILNLLFVNFWTTKIFHIFDSYHPTLYPGAERYEFMIAIIVGFWIGIFIIGKFTEFIMTLE